MGQDGAAIVSKRPFFREYKEKASECDVLAWVVFYGPGDFESNVVNLAVFEVTPPTKRRRYYLKNR